MMQNRRVRKKQMSDVAQLFADLRRWLRRAASLATETSKVKVWVPLCCSLILTGYYLYTLHSRAAGTTDRPQPSMEAPAVVAESAPPSGRITSPVEAAPTSTDRDDNYVEIRKRAAEAHAMHHFEDEAQLWQRFMAASPAPQEACPHIGKAYEQAGNIDASVDAFEKCLSLEPGNADTLVAFAHVLQTKRDFNRAAALYHECLLKDPKNFDAQTGIALIELKEDHLEQAQEAAENILHAAPDNPDALLVSGIIAWRQGRLSDAQKLFLRGEVLDDQRPDFHAFLGRIAEAEHRLQDALRQYERALALDPDDSELAARRDRLRQSR